MGFPDAGQSCRASPTAPTCRRWNHRSRCVRSSSDAVAATAMRVVWSRVRRYSRFGASSGGSWRDGTTGTVPGNRTSSRDHQRFHRRAAGCCAAPARSPRHRPASGEYPANWSWRRYSRPCWTKSDPSRAGLRPAAGGAKRQADRRSTSTRSTCRPGADRECSPPGQDGVVTGADGNQPGVPHRAWRGDRASIDEFSGTDATNGAASVERRPRRTVFVHEDVSRLQGGTSRRGRLFSMSESW